MTDELGRRIREAAASKQDEFVDLLTSLVEIESPTDHPETQTDVHSVLGPALEEIGLDVRIVSGGTTGNHLLARRSRRPRSAPIQLIVGHTDTVWRIGTLERMPIRFEEGRMHGPGTLDMKGGLTQAIVALRVLRELDLEPEVDPVFFINSDEEIGSPDSKKWVRRFARAADRAWVVEPALGDEGLIKTARKGVARFDIDIVGKAAHSGLEPDKGASAISELASLVQRIHALNDPEAGTTVNVGVIEGGVRPNVIAPHARAAVDARFVTADAGAGLEAAFAGLEATVPGVSFTIQGGVQVDPLERTPRNQVLWGAARDAARDLDLELSDALAGGGSDGNTTSRYTATLDGLGCVGDGAHADHEHIQLAPSMERCALLARLLLLPPVSALEV